MDATPARHFASVDELTAAVGQPLGTGEWLLIDQARVDRFAETTGDHQWIHTDPDRAAAGPYGATIAHGYLTLSLIPLLRHSAFSVDGAERIINYGLDRVRFPAPLRVGSRVRCHAELVAAANVPGGVQLTTRCTLEADDEKKPVCVADTLARVYR